MDGPEEKLLTEGGIFQHAIHRSVGSLDGRVPSSFNPFNARAHAPEQSEIGDRTEMDCFLTANALSNREYGTLVVLE